MIFKNRARRHGEGVRNYQARNFMRDGMKVGDMALFYHSNATPSGVAGVCRISKASFPDNTALDLKVNITILKPQKKIPSGCWSKWNSWGKISSFCSSFRKKSNRFPNLQTCSSQKREFASPVYAHRKAPFYTIWKLGQK